MEARITIQPPDGASVNAVSIRFLGGIAKSQAPVECAYGRILEARIPFESVGIAENAGVRFQFSIWQGGLPIDAIPQQGWLELPTTDPAAVGR
jgi:hypothetical protein